MSDILGLYFGSDTLSIFQKHFSKQRINKMLKRVENNPDAFEFSNVKLKAGVIKANVRIDQKDFSLSIDLRKQFTKFAFSCSCGGVKCEHLALFAVFIVNFPNELDIQLEEEKVQLSEEDLLKLREEAAKKREILDSLKLDAEFVQTCLTELDQLVVDLATQGLQRASSATLEWVNALAIKARTAKLANLERQLKYLAEIINKYLEKDIDLDVGQFLTRLNYISTLIHLSHKILDGDIIENAPPLVIFGQLRSEYVPIGNLDLQCIGGKYWRTESGFIGCTLYFCDLEKSRLLSVVNARPEMYEPPQGIYHVPTNAMGLSLADLSHGRFSFSNAKINAKNTISLSSEVIIRSNTQLPPTHEAFQALLFDDWLELVDTLRQREFSPLPGPGYQMDDLRIIQPIKYGKFALNEIKQFWHAPLLDKAYRTLSISLRNTPANLETVRNLNSLFETDHLPQAIFGSLSASEGQLLIEPISAIYYQGINLSTKRGFKLVSEFHLSLESFDDIEFMG
ncbi:MAG: hypothetical protein ACFFC7_30230 [Candidatus Hermodarchaeota archaeon]